MALRFKEGDLIEGSQGQRCTVVKIDGRNVTILFKSGEEIVRATVDAVNFRDFKPVKTTKERSSK